MLFYILKHTKSICFYILSFLPTPLPTGATEFEKWSTDILGQAKCPDNDSTRFALAVMVLHCNSTEATKPKRYFVRCLNKAAANELANDVAQGFKKKQMERQKKEAEEAASANGLTSGSHCQAI